MAPAFLPVFPTIRLLIGLLVVAATNYFHILQITAKISKREVIARQAL